MGRAMRDSLASQQPEINNTANVQITDIVTAAPGIRVARALRRKRKTTKTTKPIDRTSVPSTSLTDARIVVVRSPVTRSCSFEGIEARMEGSLRVISSTVLMTFAPGEQ